MNINDKTIIGELVATDYRIADVFSKFNIDYCCQGHRTIEAACAENQLNTGLVIGELQNRANESLDSETKYDEWPVDLLADYVVQKHHKYVENSIPVLKQNLLKLCDVHGKNHPELFKVTEAFNALADDLVVHMKKEELMLFPFIKKLKISKENDESMPSAVFNSVENPIQMMQHDHSFEGDLIQSLKQLTNDYSTPSDACTTYKVTYAKLKEFQNDMFLHIHLENNIMFPKALELEKSFHA